MRVEAGGPARHCESQDAAALGRLLGERTNRYNRQHARCRQGD